MSWSMASGYPQKKIFGGPHIKHPWCRSGSADLTPCIKDALDNRDMGKNCKGKDCIR